MADLHIGGGDDWMPVNFDTKADSDHRPTGGCGNVSTCRSLDSNGVKCGKSVVLTDFNRAFGSGNKDDVWHHIASGAQA